MYRFGKIKTVCFGGGSGMPSLLTGLKGNPWLDIKAIVNMFDSGGSSGVLRDKFGVLPPGDILKCLLALSEDEVSARKMLLRRIHNDKSPGHTGGNVLLMGMEKVYGSYPEAVDALGQVLSIKGNVIPVSLSQSALCAEYKDGSVNRGERGVDVGIFEGKEVEKLFLDPDVEASEEAVRAIEEADVFCVGPGSFYTSVLPNFLPKGIRQSIMRSSAPVIFICNLLTEGRGMEDHTIKKSMEILENFLGRKISAAVSNEKLPPRELLDNYAKEYKRPLVAKNEGADIESRIFSGDLWTDATIARHDPAALSNLVFSLIGKLTNMDKDGKR